MQNISEVLATYAHTIHTVELHSKSPAAYHPIPYKLSSFAHTSQSASYHARHPTLRGPRLTQDAPATKTRLDLVRSSSSNTSPSLAIVCKLSSHTICIVLSCCSCAFHHYSRSLVIWTHSSIIVCTIAKDSLRAVHSSFIFEAESAGRGWIASCPVSSICAAVEYPWRSHVALCVGCYCVRSLALSLWIPEEEEEETKRFLLTPEAGHRDYPHCNSHPYLQKSPETNAHRRGRLKLRGSVWSGKRRDGCLPLRKVENNLTWWWRGSVVPDDGPVYCFYEFAGGELVILVVLVHYLYSAATLNVTVLSFQGYPYRIGSGRSHVKSTGWAAISVA